MPLPHRFHRAILATPPHATARWPDEPACAAAAARLAAAWRTPATVVDGDDPLTGTVTLDGGLGAGKTTFARHLLRALGVRGPVRSPTYALVEPYALPADGDRPSLEVAHCDFYRFEDPREWEDAGLRDLFAAPGLRLVEWPSRAVDLLGPVDLALAITHPDGAPDGERSVRASAHTDLGVRWMAAVLGSAPAGGATESAR